MARKTTIPALPARTPFIDADGRITRPWLLALEGWTKRGDAANGIDGTGSGSGGGSGTSEEAPPAVTIAGVSTIQTTDKQGNAVTQVTVEIVLPDPIGTYSGSWVWDDEPDSSAGLSIADGTVAADGTTPAGGTFQPRQIGFFPYQAGNAQIVFTAPAVKENQYNRVYVSSGSKATVPQPIQHGRTGATASYQYLVTPASSTGGREYAPLIAGVGLTPAADLHWDTNPVYLTDDNGNQNWDIGVCWVWPTWDDKFAQLGGINWMLDDSGAERYLGNTPVDVGRTAGVFGYRFPVMPSPTMYTLYAVSYDNNGNSNTIVPGVTPCVPFTVSRHMGPAGEEYTGLPSNVVFTVSTASAADGTALLTILVSGDPPTDPAFGGYRLKALRPGDSAPVTLCSARLLPILWQGSNPAAVQTWTLSLVCMDAANHENTIVPGVTPQWTGSVGSTAGLLNLGKAGAGFDTGAFQVTGSVFKINALSATWVTAGALQVGGPSMVSISKFFDQLGSMIGWWGDNTSDPNVNNRYVGLWAKQCRFGGADPVHAPFQCDSSGNLTISLNASGITTLLSSTAITGLANPAGLKILLNSTGAFSAAAPDGFYVFDNLGSEVAYLQRNGSGSGVLWLSTSAGRTANLTPSSLSLTDSGGGTVSLTTAGLYINGVKVSL